jgi:eukaryotic-like serine/threonine-protein kinase
MNTGKICEKCGADLDSSQPSEVCSACLLEVGLQNSFERIGPYKILQKLGEGGCGVVYVAEQEAPVRRHVAIKVIKWGMDTKQVIARFDAERQALAIMDHPNIAKVFDAGATETGSPYFVMELVRGIKITDYCEESQLSPLQRLDLFIQVCRAVQHAHQKGVIHRDIKPSNILVALHDSVPVPKVIDFGIAKATLGRLSDQTVLTAVEQFLGTPAYMSPEQAEMSGRDIDTRSDIYSLGVLLYELLTGKTPFDARELLAVGLDEMRRTIRDVEPVKPSTRLNQERLANRARDAATFRTPQSVVADDLDWIVMKCLEKDRTRRYETVNGLATDIRKHLDNEPVVACPPSATYRFQKMVRRNKLAFTAAGAVTAALLIGLGIAASQFFAKRQAYTRAVQSEKKAQAEAATSLQVATILREMLVAAGAAINGPDEIHKPDVSASSLYQILEVTANHFREKSGVQPEVRGDIFYIIGRAYEDRNDHQFAMTNYHQAVMSFRRAFNGPHTKLSLALARLGRCQSFTGDVPSGNETAGLGLQMARQCGEKKVLIECLQNVGRSFHQSGSITSNELPFFREAFDLAKEYEDDPLLRAATMIDLARISTDEDEAVMLLRSSLILYRQHVPQSDPLVKKTVENVSFELGKRLLRTGQFEEVERVLSETQQAYEKNQSDPFKVIVLRYLAEALLVQGKAEQAESIVLEQLPIHENSYTYFLHLELLQSVRSFRSEWAWDEDILRLIKGQLNGDFLSWNIPDVIFKAGKLDQMEALYREALGKQRALFPTNGLTVARRIRLLASLWGKQGKGAESEELYCEASAMEKSLSGTIDVAKTLSSLGPEAEVTYGDVMEKFRLGYQPLEVAGDLRAMAYFLQRAGQFVEAEQLYRDALGIRKRILGDNDWTTTESLKDVASILHRQGKLPEAESLLREVLVILERLYTPNHERVLEVRKNLAEIIEKQGR